MTGAAAIFDHGHFAFVPPALLLTVMTLASLVWLWTSEKRAAAKQKRVQQREAADADSGGKGGNGPVPPIQEVELETTAALPPGTDSEQ